MIFTQTSRKTSKHPGTEIIYGVSRGVKVKSGGVPELRMAFLASSPESVGELRGVLDVRVFE
jgi:hypothetical protein